MRLLCWLGIWLLLVIGMTACGAVLGALLFFLVGRLAGMEFSNPTLIRNGAFDGGFLALIWAPGISFVTCIILSRRRRDKLAVKFPNALDTQD